MSNGDRSNVANGAPRPHAATRGTLPQVTASSKVSLISEQGSTVANAGGGRKKSGACAGPRRTGGERKSRRSSQFSSLAAQRGRCTKGGAEVVGQPYPT